MGRQVATAAATEPQKLYLLTLSRVLPDLAELLCAPGGLDTCRVDASGTLLDASRVLQEAGHCCEFPSGAMVRGVAWTAQVTHVSWAVERCACGWQ